MICPLVSALAISSVEPMFSLYATSEPFASSACLYSWPSTYCSVKFFAPTMIGVSPAAGVVRRRRGGAPPSTIATPKATAKAALAARRLCFLITCSSLPVGPAVPTP